jgi:hypothetical protein
VNPVHFNEMLAELASSPKLPGALCKHRSDEWDAPARDTPEDRVRIERAQAQCRKCPALDECRSYLRSLPAGTLSGVVAAEYCKPKW